MEIPDNPTTKKRNISTKEARKYINKVYKFDKVGEMNKKRFKTAHLLSDTSGMRAGGIYSSDKDQLNLKENYI